jgi:hypothetical protein
VKEKGEGGRDEGRCILAADCKFKGQSTKHQAQSTKHQTRRSSSFRLHPCFVLRHLLGGEHPSGWEFGEYLRKQAAHSLRTVVSHTSTPVNAAKGSTTSRLVEFSLEVCTHVKDEGCRMKDEVTFVL